MRRRGPFGREEVVWNGMRIADKNLRVRTLWKAEPLEIVDLCKEIRMQVVENEMSFRNWLLLSSRPEIEFAQFQFFLLVDLEGILPSQQ